VSAAADFADAASRLSGSIARLAGSAAEYIGTRVEQMDVAIQAERRRWFWMVLGIGAALLLVGAALVFGGLAIVIAFGDANPVLASVLVATGLLLLAALIITILWQRAHRPVTTSDRIARILALFLEGRHLDR
jgi:uncharacterized membrane protein YqjE